MAKLSDSASTDIEAPVGAVWSIVADVASWPEWQGTLGAQARERWRALGRDPQDVLMAQEGMELLVAGRSRAAS